MASSKRFIATWRNTAATAPSSAPASRSSRSAGARRPLQQALEHDVLAEDRGGLGERQRGGEVVDALGARQRGVHAVPELVGHHEHVVRARGVVEHHVRVRRGHRVRAERAAALARARRAVDVAAGEELGGHLAQLGREGAVAVEHDLLGLAVGDAVVAVGHRRHAVVGGEPVEPEEARLQPVPAAREVVAPLHRLDQRLHRLVARLVGEVARGEPVRIAAQAVLGGLVLEQGVEDEGARAQAGAERLGDRRGGLGAPLAVGSWRRERPSSSEAGSSRSGSGTSSAEVCSVNSRWKAEAPVTFVSVSTRSSGSESW